MAIETHIRESVPFVVQTDPLAISPLMSMIPAPLISVTSAHTSQSFLVPSRA